MHYVRTHTRVDKANLSTRFFIEWTCGIVCITDDVPKPCIRETITRRWITISKDMNVNQGIRAREVRLIDHNGEQLGIKTRTEALEIAARANLDLVLVAPKAKPPVARIMDHGKFKFEQQKKRT